MYGRIVIRQLTSAFGRLNVGTFNTCLKPGKYSLAATYCCTACPILRWLFMHVACRPDSRALLTAGSSSATSIPMIVMTTNSSTSVNAFGLRGFIRCSFLSGPKDEGDRPALIIPHGQKEYQRFLQSRGTRLPRVKPAS